MIFVFIAVTLVVLGVIIYFAVRNPAYLFSPSDIRESAHLSLYGGDLGPPISVEIPRDLEAIEIPQFSPDIDVFGPVEEEPDHNTET